MEPYPESDAFRPTFAECYRKKRLFAGNGDCGLISDSRRCYDAIKYSFEMFWLQKQRRPLLYEIRT